MFLHFWRNHVISSYFCLLIRLFLGWQWLSAGWGKLGAGFDAKGFLLGALQKTGGDHPDVQPWWASFIKTVALPHVGLFNFLVSWGELLVGAGLLLGAFTTFSALMGAVMNFAYLSSGAVSVNPHMLLLEMLLLAAGSHAGRWGLDHWLLPVLRQRFAKSSPTP